MSQFGQQSPHATAHAMATFLEPGRSRSHRNSTNSSGNLVNPQSILNLKLIVAHRNYLSMTITTVARIWFHYPQVPPQRYTMCSSLSFQRCLITRGVTVIALAQSFANVADIEDHAFNLPPLHYQGPHWTLACSTCLIPVPFSLLLEFFIEFFIGRHISTISGLSALSPIRL